MNSEKLDRVFILITFALGVFAAASCILLFKGVNHADDFALKSYHRVDSLIQVIDSIQRTQQIVHTHETDSVTYYLNQLEKIIQLNQALDAAQPTQMVVTVNKMSDLKTYLYSGWRVKDVISTPDSKISAILEK